MPPSGAVHRLSTTHSLADRNAGDSALASGILNREIQRDTPIKPKHNLIALSSAAVIAVYAAGYTRTRGAAERIAETEARRTSRPPPTAPTSEIAVRPQTVAPAAAPAPDSDTTTERRHPAEKARSKRKTDTSAMPVHAESTVATPSATPSAPPPVTPIPTPVPAAPIPAPTPTAVVPPPDAPSPADSSHVVLKDGVYSGWGTSRHGDIQASVEIKDGRIISATITQCRTRYPCSDVAALPGQVVKRQSPEVDIVSGATQSSDAFYYAVVEALSKAK